MAVDAAIHAPHEAGDDRNHHAHILTTTRVVGSEGLGAKTRQLDVSSTASVEIEAMRASWAERVNGALERAASDARVDHRSYARQGIDVQPTKHVGVHATGMERRAAQQAERRGRVYVPVTDRVAANAAIIERRSLATVLKAELAALGSELRQIAERIGQAVKETINVQPTRRRTPVARVGVITRQIQGELRLRELAVRTPGQSHDGMRLLFPRGVVPDGNRNDVLLPGHAPRDVGRPDADAADRVRRVDDRAGVAPSAMPRPERPTTAPASQKPVEPRKPPVVGEAAEREYARLFEAARRDGVGVKLLPLTTARETAAAAREAELKHEARPQNPGMLARLMGEKAMTPGEWGREDSRLRGARIDADKQVKALESDAPERAYADQFMKDNHPALTQAAEASRADRAAREKAERARLYEAQAAERERERSLTKPRGRGPSR